MAETMTPFFPPQVQAILAVNVKLDDGTTAPAVVLDNTIPNPRGRFYCNVCASQIGSQHNLLEHTKGHKHKRIMGLDVHPVTPNFYREAKTKKTDSNAESAVSPPKKDEVEVIELAPGEPVPPGFEDVMKKEPEICKKLSLMKSALLGLEFLAEVSATEETEEPRYLCMLCGKKGDPRTVLKHLISFNHRIRYIGRYFPRTMAAFEAIPKLREYRIGTGEILTRVAKAIENKFGRMQPVSVEASLFEINKENLMEAMNNGDHFKEPANATFHELVDLAAIKEISLNNQFGTNLKYQQENDETALLSASAKTSHKYVKPELERKNDENARPEVEVINKGNVSKAKEPAYFDKRKKLPFNKRRRVSGSPLSSLSSSSRSWSRSRSRSRSRSSARHKTFRRLPFRRTRSRSRSRSRSTHRYRRGSPYRRSPRRSPPRRSPGRPMVGRTYHSKPATSFKMKVTPSVNRRDFEEEKETSSKMSQFRVFSKNLEQEMAVKLKTYEKTPEKHPSYSEEWKKFWNKRYKELTAEGKDASKYDFKPEWIKFWTGRIKELHAEETKTKLNNFRAELGLPEHEDIVSDDELPLSPTSNKGKSKKKDADSDLEIEDDLTVLHVVRVLAALEDQLGSLGPRVNMLLVQALGLERTRPGGSEKLLDNVENQVLFETAKEKLKGQLFAGVIDKHLIKGTKRAISSIVDLLANREKRRKVLENNAASMSNYMAGVVPVVAGAVAEPVAVPGVGVIDKFAIAEQIAAILVAQGRADVSEEELCQVINAVVGMSQAPETKGHQEITVNEENDKSSLQDLLSSVVKAHNNAKIPSSLQLLQSYDERPTGPTVNAKRLSMKDMSQLSDHDLKTLLQNFNDLSRDEQQFLIAYLKDLESKDAASVAKLRRYINIDDDEEVATADSGRLSPFSSRQGGVNPTREKNATSFEDDEDEYSFEDIVKTAKKNVQSVKDAKKAAGKTMVMKMIEDQKRRAAEVMSVTSGNKSSVVIDPNDLFSGFNAESKTAVSTSEHSDSVATPATEENLSVDAFSQNITTTAGGEPMPLAATSLGPLGAIDPAPQPAMPLEQEHQQWDQFNYSNPPPNYGYPENGGGGNYSYDNEAAQQQQYDPSEYQPQEQVWTEQGYAPPGPHNPYVVPTEEYNNYSAPPPVQHYQQHPPPTQYPGYY